MPTDTKPVEPPAFSDLYGDERMRLRAVLESAGCEILGYSGKAVTVSFARGRFAEAIDAAEAAGLRHVDSAFHLFPLGSDHPPEHMRHRGPYDEPGRFSYWCRGAFEPTAALAGLVDLEAEAERARWLAHIPPRAEGLESW